MSRGINKVILIGNLGSDPQLRYTPTGHAVTNIRLATTSSWKDKNGISQERTDWHSVVLFNRRAEISAKHLRKGSKIYIEGNLRSRKWQDNEGVDRYVTEVLANNIQFLGTKHFNDGHLAVHEDEYINDEDIDLEQSHEEFFKH